MRIREVLYNWDHCGNPERILLRKMLYGDPAEVLREHSLKELRELFLKKIHFFKRQNRSFWKLILDIGDEELEQAIKGNLREAFKLWPY